MTDATFSWETLFDLAMPALDHVFPAAPARTNPDWTFGGGTALMLQIGHRISHDVDIFVHSARLARFTPRENPGAAAISSRFQWPGHYIKFERPEGEVDFLKADLQTDPGFAWATIRGRPVALETPVEIIAKKIRFRSESLKARDAFDIGAAAATNKHLPAILACIVPDALDRAREALRVIAARGWERQSEAIIATARTAAWKPQALDVARRAIDQAIEVASGKSTDTETPPAAKRRTSRRTPDAYER